MIYEFHIGLINGEEFSFYDKTKDVDKYIANLKNEYTQKHYSFVTENFRKYKILKKDIVSIGYSISGEEYEKHKNHLHSET